MGAAEGLQPWVLLLASGSACPILLPAYCPRSTGQAGMAVLVLPDCSGLLLSNSRVCMAGFAWWGWYGGVCTEEKGLSACRAVPRASCRGGGEWDSISCPVLLREGCT